VTDSNRRGERAVDDEFDDAFEADVDDTRTASRSVSAPGKAKPPTRPRTTTADRGGINPIGRLITFVREVVAELQKVIWPTRKELITYSTVVVVFVSVVTTVVSLLDLGFAKVILLVFGS